MSAQRLTDEYVALQKRFPLRPLKKDEDYEEAMEVARELLMKPSRTQEEEDYLIVLKQLIGIFDRQRAGSVQPMSGREALEYVMEQSGLSQSQMAEIAGTYQPHISAYLKGERELSKSAARKLSAHFNVPLHLFMD